MLGLSQPVPPLWCDITIFPSKLCCHDRLSSCAHFGYGCLHLHKADMSLPWQTHDPARTPSLRHPSDHEDFFFSHLQNIGIRDFLPSCGLHGLTACGCNERSSGALFLLPHLCCIQPQSGRAGSTVGKAKAAYTGTHICCTG